MASEQADRLQRDLKLADHQLFYIDSILQYNFQALTNEIEEMKKAGLQSRDTYFNAQKKWGQKTEEAFENTCKLVEEAGIDKLHVFPYSERSGTPASLMPQVPVEDRKRRAKILREMREE